MDNTSDSLLLPPIEEEQGDDPEVINSRSENVEEQKLDNHQGELGNDSQVSVEAVTDIESNKFKVSGDEAELLRIETDEEYEEDDGEYQYNDSILLTSHLESDELPWNVFPSVDNEYVQDEEELDKQEQDKHVEVKNNGMGADETITEQQNEKLGSEELGTKMIEVEYIDEEEEEKEQTVASGYKFLHLEDESESLIISDGDTLSAENLDSQLNESENISEYDDSSFDIDDKLNNADSPLPEGSSLLDDTSGIIAPDDDTNLFVADILENVIDNTFVHVDKRVLNLEDSIHLAKAHREMENDKLESAISLEKQQKKARKRLKRSFLWKSEESKLISEIESLINKRKKDVIERATLKPFTLVNAHGYNKDLRILCLHVKGDVQLCLACSHSCMLYSVQTKKVKILQGHRNLMSCFCNEPSGQWLATADIGPDNSIVIWDFINGFPLHTIFTPHPRGTKIVAFTSDSQHLISVSAGEEQMLMIWKWSKGNTYPEAMSLLPTDCDCSPIRRLDTDPVHPQYFMCTFDDRVVFVTIRKGEKKMLFQHFPREDRKLKTCGKFTSSAYGLRTHLAYTATTKGCVILWSDVSFEKSFRTDTNVTNDKQYIEIIKLRNCSINEIRCVQDRRRLLVIADDKGVISFYDITMRMILWCQESLNQPINFVELSAQRLKRSLAPKQITWTREYQKQEWRSNYSKTNNNSNETSKCKNPGVSKVFSKIYIMKMFIVATRSGDIFKMDCDGQKYEKIFSARSDPMTSIACHTNKEFIYVGTRNGVIYLYDFINEKVLLETTVKEGIKVQNGKYSVTSIGIGNLGLELAVGLEDGSLHFFNSVLLTKQESFNNSKSAIKNIVFDKNCNYLAHLDDEKSVSLYNVAGKKIFLGRYQSHYENVTDLVFTNKNCNLVSIGEDSKFSTYFLGNDGNNIEIRVSKAMDERANPLTLVPYYKPEGIIADKNQGEEFVLISNSKFKFNVCSTLTKECVKTLQAPCHGSPIRFMKILPPDYVSGERKPKYLIYATHNEIGLHALPVDGNPYKSLAVLGSPTTIQQISVSSDNKYLFTLSENDTSLLVWKIDPLAVQLSAFYGGTVLQPYYSLLEGGRDGWLMNEIKDYFYYFELVHEGELVMSKREVSNRIHLCDLINFLNAVGYFPSTIEKASIYSEVRRYHSKPDHQITLKFDYVFQLYLNHKPALGVKEWELRKAFSTLAKHRSNHSLNKSALSINKTAFIALLGENAGEELTTDEMRKILSTLVTGLPESTAPKDEGHEYNFLPNEISYKFFLEELMGLEIKEAENLSYLEKDTLSSSSVSNSLLSGSTDNM